jgi:hypothetical protein
MDYRPGGFDDGSWCLSLCPSAASGPGASECCIAAPLLFGRLWRETGCRAVLEGLLRGRRFEFSVERAIFLTVPHRLVMSGSDRAGEYWRDDYRVDGIAQLDPHHLYRAMAWLGEELAALDQPDDTLAPHRVIEDARYDGLYVLRTNTTLNALALMLRYRQFLRMEEIHPRHTADHHKTDATIRGHVFCCSWPW